MACVALALAPGSHVPAPHRTRGRRGAAGAKRSLTRTAPRPMLTATRGSPCARTSLVLSVPTSRAFTLSRCTGSPTSAPANVSVAPRSPSIHLSHTPSPARACSHGSAALLASRRALDAVTMRAPARGARRARSSNASSTLHGVGCRRSSSSDAAARARHGDPLGQHAHRAVRNCVRRSTAAPSGCRCRSPRRAWARGPRRKRACFTCSAARKGPAALRGSASERSRYGGSVGDPPACRCSRPAGCPRSRRRRCGRRARRSH